MNFNVISSRGNRQIFVWQNICKSCELERMAKHPQELWDLLERVTKSKLWTWIWYTCLLTEINTILKLHHVISHNVDWLESSSMLHVLLSIAISCCTFLLPSNLMWIFIVIFIFRTYLLSRFIFRILVLSGWTNRPSFYRRATATSSLVGFVRISDLFTITVSIFYSIIFRFIATIDRTCTTSEFRRNRVTAWIGVDTWRTTLLVFVLFSLLCILFWRKLSSRIWRIFRRVFTFGPFALTSIAFAVTKRKTLAVTRITMLSAYLYLIFMFIYARISLRRAVARCTLREESNAEETFAIFANFGKFAKVWCREIFYFGEFAKVYSREKSLFSIRES